MDAFLLFIHIAEIIIAATIVSAVMKKLNQPLLLGYIIAGIILGPLFLGGLNLSFLGLPVQIGIPSITPEVKLLSTLGAALLLFSIGIETSIQRLLNIGKGVLFGSVLQVVLVILFTFLLTVPLGLLSFEQALFLGAILAFSSTMIVVKLLSDSKELNTLQGRLMISILLLQDFLVVFIIPLLANLNNLGDLPFVASVLGKSLFLVLVAVVLNKLVFPRLFRVAAQEQELFLLSSIATAFVFIGLSEFLSIPIAIGAFVGGLALSTLPYNLEIFSKIRALRDFFLTIFFVVLGIQLGFGFSSVSPLLILVVLFLLFVIKPLVFFAVSLLLGYGSKVGVRMGLSLFQASEFGFELANIAAVTMVSSQSVFSASFFSFVIAIIALSMIITPYVLGSSSSAAEFFYSAAKKLPKKYRKGFFRRKLDALEVVASKRSLGKHIIIIGGGTVGRGLARALVRGNKIVVIDHDPEVVRQGQLDGLPYVYGTADNESLWERLDLEDARLLVITIPNHPEAIAFVKQAKELCPKITIFAEAHYFSDALDFYKNKVDFVSMPSVIGSNIFLENISKFASDGKLYRIQNFETEYLSYLEEKAAEEKRYRPRA